MYELNNFPISPDESLSSIEHKIAQLILDNQYKVRLPTKLNTKGALGIEVAIIQLLGTWLKFNKHKKIFHSYQNQNPNSFEELCSSMYGIAALSMVDEIWDTNKNPIPKGLALDSARNIVEALRKEDFENSFKSRYFGIPYIKKLLYDREFEMPFYNHNEVIDGEAFQARVERILASNICGASRFKLLKEMIDLADLSELIWEIFKNTHDHGRQDLIGNNLPENFRSIIIQQQDLTKAYIDQWCGKSPTIAQKRLRDNWYEKSDKYYVLDLSIIDFGEGFFELAKRKACSEDTVDVFLKCLEKGWSRLDDSSRGSGLTKVLNCIYKYKGWLRVRTSNLLLEKTFSQADTPDITKADVQVLNTFVAGTSIHISIPLQII